MSLYIVNVPQIKNKNKKVRCSISWIALMNYSSVLLACYSFCLCGDECLIYITIKLVYNRGINQLHC